MIRINIKMMKLKREKEMMMVMDHMTRKKKILRKLSKKLMEINHYLRKRRKLLQRTKVKNQLQRKKRVRKKKVRKKMLRRILNK